MEEKTLEKMVEEAVGEERRKLKTENDRMKLEKKKLVEQVAENEALHGRVRMLNDRVLGLETELAEARSAAVRKKEDHAREILELTEMLDGQMELERERARRATAAASAGGGVDSAALIDAHETIRDLTAALRMFERNAAETPSLKLAKLGIHPGGVEGAAIAKELRMENERRRATLIAAAATEGTDHIDTSATGAGGATPRPVPCLPRDMPPDLRRIVREAAADKIRERSVAAAARGASSAAEADALIATAEAAVPDPSTIDATIAVHEIAEEEILRRWANWAIARSGTAWTKEMSSLGEGLAAAYPLAVMAGKRGAGLGLAGRLVSFTPSS